MTDRAPLRTVGPYSIHRPLARGGMATIHYGRLRGDSGFARVVAIKRLHPARAAKPENVAMLMDEARLSSRVHHPNVVPTLDILEDDGEILLVLEYVHGESLQRVLAEVERHGERVPPAIAAAIVAGALRGVHAAHEAKDAKGEPLELIHRDLSPNNILVDSSGLPRVLDFGVAKARGRMQQTTEVGGLKGTVGYMAPEQIHGNASRQSDVFAMGVVLWETLVGEHLFTGATPGEALASVLSKRIEPPSRRGIEVTPELDRVVLKALARQRDLRWPTALDMAAAIEASIAIATRSEVAAWIQTTMATSLEEQQRTLAEIEREEVTGTSSVPDAIAAPLAERTSAPPPPRSRARNQLEIAAAAVALVAVAVVAATVTRSPPSPPPARAFVATPSPEEPEPVAAPPGPAPEPVPGPVSPRAEVRSHARPQPSPARSTARSEAERRRLLGGLGGESSPNMSTKDCNPPYTVDANGLKVWKRQCF